jgi:hypothetical protein
MQFQFNDGGRLAAGYKGNAGDCVCRSIAIVTGLPYQQVYDKLTAGKGSQRAGKNKARKWHSSARDGVWTSRKWFKEYMKNIGFTWVPTMAIGQGCKVHLKADELPQGRLVVAVSKHYTAVIDGIIQDTHDPSRDETRCVYGYWIFHFKPLNQ